MKLEAVTVCVDYADFLAHTILWNRPQFDRWIVVTASHDRRTRDICEHHHIECVVTDEFFRDGRAFVKSAGINVGLDALSRDGWVVHLDADIALPPRARKMLERAELNPKGLYGADRILCNSFEDWARYVSWPEVMHSCNTYIQGNDFGLGPRIGHLGEDGWLPIGYFQLWNPMASLVRHYPDHGSADRSDMKFARAWPRADRHLVPELFVVHLASEEETQMGSNWRGRRTPHFGPHPKRRHRHCEPEPHRHHHHHGGYHGEER
jgi:hypothetical protein